MMKLGWASAQATINANIDDINLSEWMFTMSSEEYAACAEGHQSAAQGFLPSGKRVSTNMEYVAGFFMVQHYVELISEKDRVVAVSPNSVLWLDNEKYVVLKITWELSVTKMTNDLCMLSCNVTSETENKAFVKAVNERSKNEDPAESPFQMHIVEETPLFAKDIERKALTKVWN